VIDDPDKGQEEHATLREEEKRVTGGV